MRKILSAPTSAFAVGLLACTLSVAASAEPMSGSGLSARIGAGDHYQRYELAWESPSFWTYRFEGNDSRLDLLTEVGGAYWRASGAREPSNVWQVGVAPFLRWSVNDAFYFEAGLSANYFSRTQFADKTVSTKFQFGEHVGIGAYIGERSRLGLRYSHYSNAGIKKPNDGLDVVQLLLTHQF